MKRVAANRESERGSAGIKFAIAMVIVFLVANAGYNFVPTAYEAETIKTEMQTAVLQGLAMPGKLKPVDNVKLRLEKTLKQNSAPENALLEVKQVGPSITARIAYTKELSLIPFGLYKYNYVFDHTATPTGFLIDQSHN